MPTPFPGMDPYLEHPLLWPGVHNTLVSCILRHLQPQLVPRYVARIEQRVYVELTGEQRVPDVNVLKTGRDNGGAGPQPAGDVPLVLELPEVEIHEWHIDVIDLYRKREIVTAIEVVSPSNKKSGPGRDSYVNKQREVLSTECHLVEIDLLRRGRHVMSVPEAELAPWRPFDYLVCVNRWPKRNRFELYRRQLRERLPQIRVPLTDPDNDVILDLQQALEEAYHDSGSAVYLRYDEPCEPPLAEEDQKWADECVRAFRATNPRLFPVKANGA
jgi:hypothetical protein